MVARKSASRRNVTGPKTCLKHRGFSLIELAAVVMVVSGLAVSHCQISSAFRFDRVAYSALRASTGSILDALRAGT